MVIDTPGGGVRFWQTPERRAGWQYPLGVILFLAAQALGVAATLALRGTGSAGWLATATGLGVQALVAVALYRLLIHRLAGRGVHELGQGGAAGEFGLGLAIGTALMAVVAGTLAALGVLRVEGSSSSGGILVGLMIGVGAAFAEEIFFRGILLRLLDRHFGTWPALAYTAVVFGAVHLVNPEATAWGAVAITIEAGLLLGAAYLYTRRLWLPIGIHLAWNAMLGGVIGSDVSGAGLDSGGLLTTTIEGPDWLDGGSMGLEGSVVTVVAGLALGIWLLRGAARRGHLTPAHLPWRTPSPWA
ncbi:MAG: CPBP family intramembrane metalloprotease [Kineosporiaceae bacterium]|nr:CPBP family intramembrane metalloprotease [Kineosporiaceae bacterium]